MDDSLARPIQPLDRPRGPRRRSALGVITILSWIALLACWFLQNILWSWLWVLFVGVLGICGIVAAVLTAGWMLRSLRRRQYVLAIAVLAAAGLVGGVVIAVPWGDAYSRIWYALHRDAFVRAEELVRSGALDLSGEYDGAELPDELAGISVTGRLSATSDWDGEPGPCAEPIEFAPAMVGIPDGAIGFVHLPCDAPPIGFLVNGYDDGMVPRIRLGDGWWWADGVVPDGYLDN